MANQVKRLPKTARVSRLVADSEYPTVTEITVPVKVVAGSDGPLTLKQKIQARYKAITALAGTLATYATQIQVATPFLPEGERHWIGLVVAVIGGFATLLVNNKEFVEKL